MIGKTRQIIFPAQVNSTLIEMRITHGNKLHQYKRDAYKIIDWMMDMGGLLEFIYIGGMVIAHVVAMQAYKAALISKIYMV